METVFIVEIGSSNGNCSQFVGWVIQSNRASVSGNIFYWGRCRKLIKCAQQKNKHTAAITILIKGKTKSLTGLMETTLEPVVSAFQTISVILTWSADKTDR